MTQLLQTLFGRLRDERGIALVMAVGVTTVLGVAATSVVLFTTSNESQSWDSAFGAERSRGPLSGQPPTRSSQVGRTAAPRPAAIPA